MTDSEDPNVAIINTVSKPIAEAHAPKPRRKRKKHRSRGVRITIVVARLIVIGYTTILVTLVFMEPRLVYPGAFFKDDRSRAESNPAIQSVTYLSTDSLSLEGRLLERPQAEHVVLFFHGNGNKAKWSDRWLLQLSEAFNATVMAAEYRGYNDDTKPHEKGVLADCFAARDFLCDRYSLTPKDIVLYGRSLGGGCAVAVASQGGAKAMVLERTFDRLVNVAAGKYPYIPVHFLMKNRYDSIAKLSVYKAPLVVLHGTTDKLIPIKHSEALYKKAPSAKKHWIAVEGLGHNDALSSTHLREIAAKVNEFLAAPMIP
ncbi:MAG: alpha/beta hydrolase [Rubripirellula sp.]